ncbi:MAG: phosphatase [Flavobacteriales bacterium]|nr:phosphatase [Flavobacteriales bacterium]
MKAKVLILDVDGIMTTGQFIYSKEGKVMKIFGPDDSDALNLLKPYMEIRFVTADERGLPISKKRITDDMGYQLDLVGTLQRVDWIKERFNLKEVIYMGDGIFDHYVMREVGYSIATSNSDNNAKDSASYITERCGGDRAVAEACLHILQVFFTPYKPQI